MNGNKFETAKSVPNIVTNTLSTPNPPELPVSDAAEEKEEPKENTTANSSSAFKSDKKPKENKGVYIHHFKPAREIGGKKYETLNFYFERLTGSDMLSVEQEMTAMNEFVLTAEISKSFQSKIAARAAGIASDDLEMLPIYDFNKITNAARLFLLDSGY